MKKQIILLTTTLLTSSLFSNLYSQKIPILGEKVKSKILCADCNPGNSGDPMILNVKTYAPVLTENSIPKEMATQLLGRVYFDGDVTGDLPTYCAGQNSITNPFPSTSIVLSGNTGSNGTTIKYSWKKKSVLDVSAQVQADLTKIKSLQPALEQAKLDAFSAELTAAYSKFANKKLSVTGKYYEYMINPDDLIMLAKEMNNYKECNNLIYTNNLRIINAIGLVYFDITSSSQSIDEVATDLQAKATSYGINYSVKFSFKQTISKSIEKFTIGYYQVVVWKTMTKIQLDKLALKTPTN
jgi:hypothetical protein